LSILAAKISLYTSSRFLGYSSPFLKNLLVKGEIIVVYTPGGGHKFYEELGPASRSGADRQQIAALFEKYGMTLLGPPLSLD